MKFALLVLAACSISLSSFADSQVHVIGTPAKNLMESLEAANAFVDCGMGLCGTVAESVDCKFTGNSTGEKSYNCSLSTQDEKGTMTSSTVMNTVADNLYHAIQRTGVIAACGMGTCGVEVKSIECTYRNGIIASNHECTVTTGK